MTINTTTELPAVTAPRDDETIDRAIADLAVPVEAGPPPTDRLLGFFGHLTATPLRSSLLTAWAFAAVVTAITWLAQPTRPVRTALGPARVSCGIDVYFYGYPDRAVASTCRHAEALNFGLFVPAAIAVLAGLVAAALIALNGRTVLSPVAAPTLLTRLREVPASAALVVLGLPAVVVGLFALRPAPVTLIQNGVAITARCGADSYFGFLGGYPDHNVATACSRAYSGRAHVLEICVVVALLASVVLLQLAFSKSVPGWRKLRTTVVMMAGALTVVTALALAPVAVPIGDGATPEVARCGIDTFLAGYPDQAVQSACRSHYAGHAAVGLVAGGGTLALAGWGAVAVNRRRYPVRNPEPTAARGTST